MTYEEHIRTLAKQLGAIVVSDEQVEVEWSVALNRSMVVVPLLETDVAYAAALHELGHCRGESFIDTVQEEQAAWLWARENAMEWTDAMERSSQAALATYTATLRTTVGTPTEAPKQSLGSFLDKIGVGS